VKACTSEEQRKASFFEVSFPNRLFPKILILETQETVIIMSDKSLEFKLCPKCGSTEYLEDYPDPGKSICTGCGTEIVTITLRKTAEKFSVKHKCPFCGKEGNREDRLGKTGITVYKCKGCGKLDGLLEVGILDDSEEYFSDDLYSHKSVAIAEKEGRPLYSASKAKEVAKALRAKEKDPEEKCKKELAELIREKRQKMRQIGVESQTIERAIREISFFIEREEGEGLLTKKQLESLFSGAATLAQEDLLRMVKFKGKRITERQMEEIFNTDRKTTRKWKKALKKNATQSHMGFSRAKVRINSKTPQQRFRKK
jgi:predicted RNA-binding Zn-ribbon protein involved in translation (DUF1610 family)